MNSPVVSDLRELAGDFDPAECESWSLASLGSAILDRRISAVDAVKRYLDRIERIDSTLGCYNEVYADRSLKRAAEVDRKIAAGESVGPLAGCPIAIKDNLCTDWGHTTCSSRMLANFRSPYNATAVRRLLEADAIVLGKTNLDEFAMGSSCENSALHMTLNPWDGTRVPGGSSGGIAAAVAASLCVAGLGSDTGGSVRLPASYCGVVGFKPTYGSVSRYGLVAFASSLDQIGPVTRTVGDAAILHHRVRGFDPHDSTTHPRANEFEVLDLLKPMQGMRLGVPKQYRENGNDASVESMIDESIRTFESMGARIVDVDLEMSDYAIPTYYIVCMAEASSNLARYDGIRFGRRAEVEAGDTLDDLYCKSRGEGFGDEVKRRIMIGTFALSAGYHDQYYNRALRARRLVSDDFDRAFERCDVILGPTSPTPAFRIAERTDDPMQMYLIDIYTVSANLAGLPAISIPAGRESIDGKTLPLGLQLTGPAFGDTELLQIARAFETQTDWYRMAPTLGA